MERCSQNVTLSAVKDSIGSSHMGVCVCVFDVSMKKKVKSFRFFFTCHETEKNRHTQPLPCGEKKSEKTYQTPCPPTTRPLTRSSPRKCFAAAAKYHVNDVNNRGQRRVASVLVTAARNKATRKKKCAEKPNFVPSVHSIPFRVVIASACRASATVTDIGKKRGRFRFVSFSPKG